MTHPLQHVRHGFGCVRPYVHGHLAMWDMVKDAFGAVELDRQDFGGQHSIMKPRSVTP